MVSGGNFRYDKFLDKFLYHLQTIRPDFFFRGNLLFSLNSFYPNNEFFVMKKFGLKLI
jgi:hypothetical protein